MQGLNNLKRNNRGEWGGAKQEWGGTKQEWGGAKQEWGGAKQEWGDAKQERYDSDESWEDLPSDEIDPMILTYQKILNVGPNADRRQIKEAFKVKALFYSAGLL